MTYGELVEFLNSRPDIHGQDVTVYDAELGEFCPADIIDFSEVDDVLDQGHIFISIKAEQFEV